MASLSLAFDILARDRASGTFDKVSRSAGGLQSKLGGMAKAVGGAFALREVAQFGKGLYDAAVESQKVTAQTEAVIKSMGGAAGVTAGQVADLSVKLAMQSGVDDELIQSGQNVLLTFANVRNEAGKTGGVFDRASAAALDMSVALGTDMKSASMQVGKALNDPVRGLAALRRSGVQFTKQQEDQIKTMVEAGDVTGAQTIMLKELERQFGGSAAAQATAGDRLQVVWGNLQETLGEKLLPIVETVATFLADNLPRALAFAERAFGGLRNMLDIFKADGLSGLMEDIGKRIQDAWPTIQAALGSLAQGLWDWIVRTVPVVGEQLLQLGAAFVQWVGPQIPPLLAELGKLIGRVGSWIVETGLPALGMHALNLAAGLIEWVATEAIPGLLAELPKMPRRIWDWIKESGVPAFTGMGKRLGGAVVDGFKQGIIGLFSGDAWFGKSQGGSMRIPGTDYRVKIPIFADGGVMPGARGQHGLALLAGGETVLPTHKQGWTASSGGAYDALGEDQLLELRRNNSLVSALISEVRSGRVGTIAGGRAASAVMG